MVEHHILRRFLVQVFLLLLPCFALWHYFSGPLAAPAIGLVNMLLEAWYPEVIEGLYAEGSQALLMTRFGELNGTPVPLAQSDYRFAFRLDTRIITYSLAFYSALHLATRQQRPVAAYFAGVTILYALIVLGLLSLCLKDMLVGLGPAYIERAQVIAAPGELIGVAYQLSVLMVPTLAPVLVWGWQSRSTPLLRW
jgi:hypothetical protein